MNILVTGGFGFLGAHLVESLLEERHSVRILDNNQNPTVLDGWIQRMSQDSPMEVTIGDIRDQEVCKNACEGVDVVFHTAGIVSIPRSFQEPQLTYEINVNATENLLKACVGANVKKFIHASSAKIYGKTKAAQYDESASLAPTTPYAVSKVAAEQLCRHYAKFSGLDVVALRYFSIYGPRQRLFDGLIGDIFGCIINRSEITLHASKDMERDFVHIFDAVQMSMLAMKSTRKGFEVFNVGSGERCSLPSLVDTMENVLGKPLHVNYLAPLEGTTIKTCADISKARTELNYQPRVTLKAGLKQSLDYFTEELDKSRNKNQTRKVTAVILTGGKGTRVSGEGLPKQFIPVAGKPLFVHTLETYERIEAINEICLVINASYIEEYERVLSDLKLTKLTQIVSGGEYRHESVRNAIDSIDREGFVVIQNGASPATSPKLINACIEEARKKGAVTAFVPAAHTVFVRGNQQVRSVLERERIGYTCDPQVFNVEILAKSIEYSEKLVYGRDVPTVDLVKRLGHQVHLVESKADNIKVTTRSDISALEFLISKEQE